MKLLFQLYDNVAKATLGSIIKSASKGAAIRDFQEILADKTTTPGRFPQDIVLLYLGNQDEDTGAILVPPDPVAVVATGQDWLDARVQE